MNTLRKRYGRRAAGKTQTSMSCEDELLDRGKRIAEERGITFSALMSGLIEAEPDKRKVTK